MKKTVRFFSICMVAGVLVTLLSGSAIFKGWRAGEAEWIYVYIPETCSYNQAFEAAVDVLSESYEMGIVNKNERYAYTSWKFFRKSTGGEDKNTRSRVTLKFSSDGRRIAVRTEVQMLHRHHWRDGYIEKFSRQTCDKIQMALDNF